MHSLQAFVQPFWQIAIFRAGPDSLPDSRPLLLLVLVVYIAIEAVTILALKPSYALPPMLLVDVGFLVLWCAGLLRLFGFGARLQQTLSALFGTGAILMLLSFPLRAWPVFGFPLDIPFLRFLVSLVILLWTVAVYAHIFSKAISRSLGVGLTFALIYFLAILQFAAQWPQAN
jgi:hypothetical protein